VEIMALFQELGRAGMTVVLVTHEPDIAEYTRRVLTMRDGRIERDEAREQLPAMLTEASLPPPAPPPSAGAGVAP
jgi:putative ABC transport system ATP-binding protein